MANYKKTKVVEKLEFSKIMVLLITVFGIILVLFSCLMMWKTQDLSSLPQLLIGAFATIASSFAFYSAKAKSENLAKINQIVGSSERGEL